MNTQTHILLACAVLLPAVPTVRKIVAKRGQVFVISLAAIVGAVLPDASIFVMWGIAKAQGVAESVIWREWYFSDFWQLMGALSNSIPMYIALATTAYLLGGRFRTSNQSNSLWVSLLLILSVAALLHVVTDLPLHHDDGHPHFWPFSGWIFSSPVSYWDPNHYGKIWSFIEIGLALLLVTLLWRRFKNRVVRALLIFVSLSYVVVAGYWMSAF